MKRILRAIIILAALAIIFGIALQRFTAARAANPPAPLYDLIIRNGENISPKEVEDLLLGHPNIAQVAIVGLPDPRTGERACAVIVPRNLPGPDVASLRAFLDSHGVATFKVPEQVAIWEALPKNDAGKILKHQIRSALAPKS